MITLILFLSIILLPWWFYLPMLLLAILLVPNYWPAILLGFLVDTLYGTGFWIALSSLLILLALIPIRERIRF